jgi:hypothetical protein
LVVLQQIKREPKGKQKILSSLPVLIDAVCYEAGPTGFSLARSLKTAGIRVTVVAPSRIPHPMTTTFKTASIAENWQNSPQRA